VDKEEYSEDLRSEIAKQQTGDEH